MAGEVSSEQSSAEGRFDAVYRAHHRAVLGYALRRVGPDAAPDIVGETFLVAWRRLEEIPEDALPWLLAVARKTLANQLRAMRRADALSQRMRALQPATLFEAPPTADDAVLRAFANLAEADREVLALVAWEGLTPRQAARVLGTTAVALRVRLHRARRRLAAALAREEENPFAPRRLPESAIAKEVT